MKHFPRVATFMALCVLASAPLAAQSPDITGTWSVQVSATLPEGAAPCEFQGTIQFAMVDGVWIGPASLTLISGPAGCPAEMIGDCSGTFDGGTFYGTLSSKMSGTAAVTATPVGADVMKGTVGGAPKAVGPKATLAPKSTTYGGPMAVQSGPYTGGTGTFVAARQTVLEIPTLTETGLLLLAILLMATATYLLMRGRRQQV